MKQLVSLLCAVHVSVTLFAQVTSLCLATNKTTSLVFPFAVRHVDRGSADVLVQPVKEAENILLVKAAKAGFPETNLSVITSDGSLYTFSVCFDATPLTWVYELPAQTKTSTALYAKSLLDNPPILKGIRYRKGDVEATLSGVYVRAGALFLQLRIVNRSAIDYTVDYLRFYLRDRQRLNRTAAQETELMPLHTAGNAKTVKAGGATTVVVALEAFVIPDQKVFVTEAGEKNGGRSLTLQVHNRQILNAIALPDLQ